MFIEALGMVVVEMDERCGYGRNYLYIHCPGLGLTRLELIFYCECLYSVANDPDIVANEQNV